MKPGHDFASPSAGPFAPPPMLHEQTYVLRQQQANYAELVARREQVEEEREDRRKRKRVIKQCAPIFVPLLAALIRRIQPR